MEVAAAAPAPPRHSTAAVGQRAAARKPQAGKQCLPLEEEVAQREKSKLKQKQKPQRSAAAATAAAAAAAEAETTPAAEQLDT